MTPAENSTVNASIGDSEKPEYNGTEMEEAKLTNEGGDKKKGDEESDVGDDEMSGSYADEEPSTVDMAEKNEQQVRKSLLFACLSACGLIFVMQLIGRLMGRCASSDDAGADDAVAAGREATNAAANNQAV